MFSRLRQKSYSLMLRISQRITYKLALTFQGSSSMFAQDPIEEAF